MKHDYVLSKSSQLSEYCKIKTNVTSKCLLNLSRKFVFEFKVQNKITEEKNVGKYRIMLIIQISFSFVCFPINMICIVTIKNV